MPVVNKRDTETMNTISRNNGRDYLVWRAGSGGTIEIFNIFVLSERRKSGIGRKMIEELRAKAEKSKKHLIFAITRLSNKNAQQFYEKTGFYLIAELPGFYSDESALMYGLLIKKCKVI